MKRWLTLVFLSVTCLGICGPKHARDGKQLPQAEQEFAQQLSVYKRRIFCGQFNAKQRQMAMRYAAGVHSDSCATPDEAVLKVMSETGMSLVEKGRRRLD